MPVDFYQQIRLTPEEIDLLRDALRSYEREQRTTMSHWPGNWQIRTACQRSIDAGRHLDRILGSCVPHDD